MTDIGEKNTVISNVWIEIDIIGIWGYHWYIKSVPFKIVLVVLYNNIPYTVISERMVEEFN